MQVHLRRSETLPKALRTQALTTLTSNFNLEGLIHLTQLAKLGLVW